MRTPEQLSEHGLIAPEQRAALEAVAARYAVAVPPALAALIDRDDPDDPIARQFIPDIAELDRRPEEDADPIGDDAHSPVEGIVHRYPDRVLLKLTPICAVYCRFCFRREMVGPGKPGALSAAALDARARLYPFSDPNIWEVILTGGDPLVLSARRLRAVMKDLSAIDHVKIVRIHTRLPVADPARITPELVRAMKAKGQGGLRRRARQSSARIDRMKRARRWRAWPTPGWCCSASRCCSRASMMMRPCSPI